MSSTRVYALILLLILVSVGLLLTRNLYWPNTSPRIDPLPQGAYVIPWLTTSPNIGAIDATPPTNQPWHIDLVMRGAMTFDVNFHIPLPNGTRLVPSTVYVGHDQNFLYVGGIFRGIYSNPTSTSTVEYNERFNLLLDTDNDGILTNPESGSVLLANIGCSLYPSNCGLGADGWGASALAYGYTDMAWNEHAPFIERSAWEFAGDICTAKGLTYISSVGGYTVEYNVWNGTLVVLFSRHLFVPGACNNGLQMRLGERWVMSFLLELGYQNQTAIYQDLMDGWPMNVYPYLSNSTTSWPKLVVDLTNPP